MNTEPKHAYRALVDRYIGAKIQVMELNGTLGIPTKSMLLVCWELNNYHAYRSPVVVYIGGRMQVLEHVNRAESEALLLHAPYTFGNIENALALA
jgi:hypothetical protein